MAKLSQQFNGEAFTKVITTTTPVFVVSSQGTIPGATTETIPSPELEKTTTLTETKPVIKPTATTLTTEATTPVTAPVVPQSEGGVESAGTPTTTLVLQTSVSSTESGPGSPEITSYEGKANTSFATSSFGMMFSIIIALFISI
ncbi:unnamed protein product [[Candida] boidinii]|nr:unnamed protein product [[Candida] boidinii]